ncbi:S1 family peptidase [Nocardiopsis suaedae]|uniref:Trypsin-like serine protease n=1 Tax=Nocardiopsis suaedae TaxID=3018444 RepID=A0ABT4TMW6_9ACTN|nr:trypsin-like serine protease [Nocardiopsis suaedae]MDA2806040.1 trypsin-like serine protease [Nocardiopsis suaedae]
MKTAALLLVPVLLYAGALAWELARPDPGRIPGSGPASTDTYPWVVAVGFPEESPDTPSHKGCAGTLVAPKAVVTAGHCLLGSTPEQVTVTAGRTDLRTDDGHTRNAAAFWIEPGYAEAPRQSFLGGVFGQRRQEAADLALILLEEEMPGEPLPLASPSDPPSGNDTGARLLGWRVSPQDEPVLWQAPTTVAPDRECLRRARESTKVLPPTLHGVTYDTHDYLCAGTERPLTVRASDSGAPLVSGGRLVGVVAWAPGSGPDVPDYFARIAPLSKEITERIQAFSHRGG